jgi:hypothetical protein
MQNTKTNSSTTRQRKTEIEKKLDLIMAKLHKLENSRFEIEKEIRKMCDSEKLNDLRKKFLNK